MKKKLFSVGLATAVALCSAVSVGASDELEVDTVKQPSYAMVIWSETFNSIDEVIQNSDATIVGTVESQSVELVHDLYFTHSYVTTDSGQTYDVLQTGAVINGVPTNILNDTKLLEENEEYFLCLKESEYNGREYYLITGGNQGYGIYHPTLNTVTAVNYNNRALFSSMQIEETNSGIDVYNLEPLDYSLMSNVDGFNPDLCKWDKSRVTFRLQTSIENSFGTTVHDDLIDGAESWNGLSSLRLSETSSTSEDIEVIMHYYPDDWVGQTTADYTADDNPLDNIEYIFDHVEIRFDKGSDGDRSHFWQGISCHEFGHAVGLSHYDASWGLHGAVMASDVATKLINYNEPYTPQIGCDDVRLDEKY